MTPRLRKANSRFAEVPGSPDLELDTKSGVYYVRKFLRGKGELFRSTRSKKKGLAKTIAEEMIAEFRGRKPGLRSRRLRIDEACDLALKQCELEATQKDEDGIPLRGEITLLKDRRMFPEIKKLFGEYYCDEVDEAFLRSWTKKQGRRLGIKLGDHFKYLSKVLTYAFDEAYIARKPRIKNPDKPPKKKPSYSQSNLEAFVKAAEPMLLDMTLLGAENPLRPNEVDGMQWAFLDFTKDRATGEEVTILRIPAWFEKRREARELTLSANANRVLRERHARRDKNSPYVFPAPKDPKRPCSRAFRAKMWRRMIVKARKLDPSIPAGRLTFHGLRASFYRHALVVLGLPLPAVSLTGGTSMKVLQENYLDIEAHQTRAVTQAVNLRVFGKPKQEEE